MYEPDPAAYGVWVKGIPVLVGEGLEKAGAADWLAGLINDGIVAGVGAVLGFVPQMLVLFLLLAILEGCGYMARIAFVLDRISANSVFPANPSSRCSSALAAAFPVLWHPERLKTNVTAA